MTVNELRRMLEERGDTQAIEDIFYTTDLRLPPGVKIPRDPNQIQRWLKNTWEENDAPERKA